MTEQLVRGFAYFPGRNLEEVRESFRNFSVQGMEFRYFDELTRYGNYTEAPGVFLSGKADWRFSSGGILYLMRKTAGLPDEAKDCDISAESEDRMTHCIQGDLSGAYLGLLMEPPREFHAAEDAAQELGCKVGSHDILVRDVYFGETPMISADFLLENDEAVLEALESSDAGVFRKDLYTCLELI